jgi:hypothetical protein
MDVAYFDKPSPEQEAKQKAALASAIRKTLLVSSHPIKSAKDFLSEFEQRHAYQIDISGASDDALEIAAELKEWIVELNDAWELYTEIDRVSAARSVMEVVCKIEAHGFVCHMGSYKQQAEDTERPLVFDVGLLVLMPKSDGEGVRYAMVNLPDGWETLQKDRPDIGEERNVT